MYKTLNETVDGMCSTDTDYIDVLEARDAMENIYL